MELMIQSVTAGQAGAYRDQLAAVYRAAFAPPPYRKGEAEFADFEQSFPRHAGMDGFRLVMALPPGGGTAAGFAYGFANSEAQWWHQAVARALPEGMIAQWLTGSFRLAEMAVVPAAQGKGVGGRLHDQLLGDVPYQRAVLSTMAADTPAAALYRRRGWRPLLAAHMFPGVDRPYQILGIALGQQPGGKGGPPNPP